VRLRYQYSFCFLKAKKWNPYIGVSNLHTFEKIKKQPYVLEEFTSQFRTGFKRTSVMYDLTLAAVPGIKGTLGKRMVVDLGFPVRFLMQQLSVRGCIIQIYQRASSECGFPPVNCITRCGCTSEWELA
jgi:hypothetical protein